MLSIHPTDDLLGNFNPFQRRKAPYFYYYLLLCTNNLVVSYTMGSIRKTQFYSLSRLDAWRIFMNARHADVVVFSPAATNKVMATGGAVSRYCMYWVCRSKGHSQNVFTTATIENTKTVHRHCFSEPLDCCYFGYYFVSGIGRYGQNTPKIRCTPYTATENTVYTVHRHFYQPPEWCWTYFGSDPPLYRSPSLQPCS